MTNDSLPLLCTLCDYATQCFWHDVRSIHTILEQQLSDLHDMMACKSKMAKSYTVTSANDNLESESLLTECFTAEVGRFKENDCGSTDMIIRINFDR